MKKNIFYLICVITLLTSCSSAYRSSQTPDDVYYSPGKKMNTIASADGDDNYLSYSNSSDDNYLRMKTANHYRWSDLDDYDYWNDSRYYYNNYYSPYTSFYSPFTTGLSFGLGYYNPYTSFWYNPWNSWYSPYYTVVYYKNPTVYYNTGRSNYHLSTYSNRTYNNNNVMPLQNRQRNSYNNSNSVINRNNYNSNRNDNIRVNQNQNNDPRPVRTFQNNSGSSNSGSRMNSGGGGGGSVSRPSRGGH